MPYAMLTNEVKSHSPKATEMTNASAINVKDLHKSFGSKQVLKGIDLEVARGDALVVIGGSGSGKSVLLKCILGLQPPDCGSVLIDGEETAKWHGRRRERLMQKFGMLFQGGALFDSLPVWQNITFALKGIKKQEAIEVATEKLQKVGLSADVAFLRPAELSGGMQKRVSLARAITGQPEIIFFDEPTTGLDPIMADVINELIVSITRELGVTTVTITHDMSSVRKIASRVAMIYQGDIIWDGPASSIDDSGNEYLDQFVHGRSHGPIHIEAGRK